MVIFLKDIKKYPLLHLEYSRHKKKPYLYTFLQYFIFVIILISLVFIGTIGIHEFGHFAMANYYDCEYSRIIYQEYPVTETICKNMGNKDIFLIGGVVSPFLIAILLLIVGGKFIRDIALLMIGFNLIFNYKDLLDLGLTDNLVMTSTIFGVIFLIIGITILARSTTEQYIHGIFEV
jgi:hypothetical protein